MVPNRTRRARGIFNVPTTLYFFCNLNGLGFAKTILWGHGFRKTSAVVFLKFGGGWDRGRGLGRNAVMDFN